MDDASAIVRGVRDLLSRTVHDLEASGAPDEALAELNPAHRRLGISRPAVLKPSGRAWRLGALLLDRAGRIYATGAVTRAIEPKRGVANHSHAADLRREDQRSAVRGHFAEGEVVNFGFRAIALDEDGLRSGSGPLFLDDDVVMVRWAAGSGGVSRLDSYLMERVRMKTLD